MSFFLAATDTVHNHKLSLSDFTCLSDALSNTHTTFGTRWIFTVRCSTAEWRINTNPISHKLWAQNAHRGPKRSSLKTSSREKLSLKGILARIRIKYRKHRMRSDFQNPITEDMDEFGKVVAEMSYIQSQMHSDYHSVEKHCRLGSSRWRTTKYACFTTADAKSRRLWITSNNNCTWETFCIVAGERCKCKAYSNWSKRKLDVKYASEPRALRKPAALLSLGSEEPGNQFKSSVFRYADPSNLVRSLLEGNKDHFAQSGKIWINEARTPSWISP